MKHCTIGSIFKIKYLSYTLRYMDTKITYSLLTSINKKHIETLFEQAKAEIKKIIEERTVEQYKVSSNESAV